MSRQEDVTQEMLDEMQDMIASPDTSDDESRSVRRRRTLRLRGPARNVRARRAAAVPAPPPPPAPINPIPRNDMAVPVPDRLRFSIIDLDEDAIRDDFCMICYDGDTGAQRIIDCRTCKYGYCVPCFTRIYIGNQDMPCAFCRAPIFGEIE